ncbi:hypothetical protein [Cohnella sp. JJ-181]|uniref:hypothetical protein n=1 Tax=Cohnella rhizoplanae TaxID=2974897 RepID=UPI0022FF61E6|nr:hypothetical protein [Cohnella sp. JJ-181]CAI6069031.1 hypothetical protein COHCIP112018_02204 [Cohnella sp. JJ-181]
MAENAVPYDYIIDADGLKENVTLLRTVDRYMESIQRRVDRLSRMRVVIPIRLSDCLCEPIKRIRASLDSLTKLQWIVPVTTKIDLALDSSIFSSAGLEAGKSFSSSFEAALDPTALIAKVQAALEGMRVKVAVSGGKDSSGDSNNSDNTVNWAQSAVDLVSNIISGTIGGYFGNYLGDKRKDRLERKAGRGSDPASSNNKQHPEGTILDSKERPMPSSRKPLATRFKDLGKSTIEFGKKAINKTKNWMGGGPGSGIVPSNGAPTNSIPEKRSLSPSEKSRGFSSSKRGFTGTSSQRTLSQAMNNPVPKLAGSKLLKTAGKWVKPLGYITTAASIASAKPGEERNKLVRGAAGNAAGTAIGAALGSIVPGAGTLVGGLVGGYVGEKLAEGKVGKAVQGWVTSGAKWVRGLGKKKSKNKEANSDEVLAASSQLTLPVKSADDKGPSKTPAHSLADASLGLNVSPLRKAAGIFQTPGNPKAFAAAPQMQAFALGGLGMGATLGRSGTGAMGQNGLLGGLLPIVEWFKSRLNGPTAPAAVGASSTSLLNQATVRRLPVTPTVQQNPLRQPANPPAPTININIPAGAVQLTVKETEIDYNAITAQISTRLSASIRQTLENRP